MKMLSILFLFTFSSCGLLSKKESSKQVDLPTRYDEEIDERTPEEKCEAFKEEIDGQLQGTVRVPENWDNPFGKSISVFYYLGSERLDQSKDTVVFYNGGPAGSSHSSWHALKKRSEFDDYNFVFIDQRGTGCSERFPETEYWSTIFEGTHWGSPAIVKDSEAIREKLLGKGSRWKVFGQSYGGQIVHRYVNLAPESIISAHSHGFSIRPDVVKARKLRHLSQLKVANLYFYQNPDVKQTFDSIVRQLHDGVCVQYSDEKPICGRVILDGITSYLGFKTAWNRLGQWLDSLLDDNGVLDRKQLAKFNYVFNESDYTDSRLNWGGSTISYAERGSADYGPAGGCKQVVEELADEGMSLSEWPFAECRLSLYYYNPDRKKSAGLTYQIEKVKDIRLKIEETKKTLESNPNLKFYLYSGQYDTFVPPTTFPEEVNALEGLIEYHDFPTSGHEGFYTEGLVWKNLAK